MSYTSIMRAVGYCNYISAGLWVLLAALGAELEAWQVLLCLSNGVLGWLCVKVANSTKDWP